jgi:hypothetical protein
MKSINRKGRKAGAKVAKATFAEERKNLHRGSQEKHREHRVKGVREEESDNE